MWHNPLKNITSFELKSFCSDQIQNEQNGSKLSRTWFNQSKVESFN